MTPLIILVCVLAAALVGLHLWWKSRYLGLQQQQDYKAATLMQQHEQTAREARSQQQVLFNSMLEGLLLLDRKRQIYLVNRAFKDLFAVTGDLRGKTIMEALRSHELADLVERVEKEGQVLDAELRLSGFAERWLQVNAAAIADASGGREGFVLVFRDLTRIKQLEGARVDFVANVSHELRTPLSMIKGYVETLLGGAKDDPATAAKFLQTVERHTNRLTLLIEDLLTISALESGRIQLNLKPLLLQPAVEKVFADFKPRADARKMSLTSRMPALTASADGHRLQQVLSNLVDNAIKYGRMEGEVVVSGRALPDGFIEVYVQDDGPGIPAEALERIFERFYRVDKARSRDQGGTGLGLSIVKHIVQVHGGRVWAKSQPVDGTTFYFTLPSATGSAQSA